MLESERALKAAYQRLATDATFTGMLPAGAQGIHEGVAPEGTATPFVVLDVPAATDVNTLEGTRVMQDALVSVAVRGAGPTSAIVPIADRADALMQGHAATQDGARVEWFRRVRGGRLPVTVDARGIRRTAILQIYRSEVYAT